MRAPELDIAVGGPEAPRVLGVVSADARARVPHSRPVGLLARAARIRLAVGYLKRHRRTNVHRAMGRARQPITTSGILRLGAGPLFLPTWTAVI